MSLGAELPDPSIGLGTAGFAFRDVSETQAVETIRDAVAHGVRLIDTARAYTRQGEESTAETLVARALRGSVGSDVLVATKGGHWRDGERFPIDGRPETLRRHCEASLLNLGREQIDLYLLHHVDPGVPLEESMAALRDLQRAGSIRYLGLSNVTVDQLERASQVATISAVQNRLSLDRAEDLNVARECSRRSVVFLAYSPLGGGGSAPPAAAVDVARRRGVSPAQVQLAWLLAASPGVVPIVGATRSATVHDSLRAAEMELSPADLEKLASSAPINHSMNDFRRTEVVP